MDIPEIKQGLRHVRLAARISRIEESGQLFARALATVHALARYLEEPVHSIDFDNVFCEVRFYFERSDHTFFRLDVDSDWAVWVSTNTGFSVYGPAHTLDYEKLARHIEKQLILETARQVNTYEICRQHLDKPPSI